MCSVKSETFRDDRRCRTGDMSRRRCDDDENYPQECCVCFSLSSALIILSSGHKNNLMIATEREWDESARDILMLMWFVCQNFLFYTHNHLLKKNNNFFRDVDVVCRENKKPYDDFVTETSTSCVKTVYSSVLLFRCRRDAVRRQTRIFATF